MDESLHLTAFVENGGVYRTPPPLLETASRSGDVVFEAWPRMGSARGQNPLQRGAQEAHTLNGRIVPVVWKHFKNTGPDKFLARPFGRSEIEGENDTHSLIWSRRNGD